MKWSYTPDHKRAALFRGFTEAAEVLAELLKSEPMQFFGLDGYEATLSKEGIGVAILLRRYSCDELYLAAAESEAALRLRAAKQAVTSWQMGQAGAGYVSNAADAPGWPEYEAAAAAYEEEKRTIASAEAATWRGNSQGGQP